MPALAANKHNKLPSKYLTLWISPYKKKRKGCISLLWEREDEKLRGVWALQLSVFAAVERRENVISVAFSIQTKHTQTYTHCMNLSSNLSIDRIMCACMCAQCHCLRAVQQYTCWWWRRSCSAGERVSEIIVFFIFYASSSFLYSYLEDCQTHSQRHNSVCSFCWAAFAISASAHT